MNNGRDFAETVALRALAWLVGNDALLPAFLAATGADATTLRGAAGDAAFLGSVLDFLLGDDAWVVAFCDSAGVDYTVPMTARQNLPGGEIMHWT